MKSFFSALLFLGLVAGVTGDADCKDRPFARTTLSEVRTQPEAWLNTPIVFEARFHALGEIFQPFYTPFDSFSFANFSAWDVSQAMTSQEQFLDHCPTLYVDRRMKAKTMQRLAHLSPFQRFEAKGYVRQVFNGRPFIEVVEIKPHKSWRFWWTPDDHREDAFGRRQ